MYGFSCIIPQDLGKIKERRDDGQIKTNNRAKDIEGVQSLGSRMDYGIERVAGSDRRDPGDLTARSIRQDARKERVDIERYSSDMRAFWAVVHGGSG